MSKGVSATEEGALRLAREMSEAALGLAAATCPADVAAVALAALSRGLGAASGALWMLDEARGGLVRAGQGLGEELGLVPYSDESPAGHVLRRDAPVFLEDAAAYEARFPVSWARVKDYATTGDRAFAVVPASVSASEPRAVLVAWFDGPRAFSEDERSLLTLLGRLCAHSLERSDLLARNDAEARRAALAAAHADRLLQLASALAGANDVDGACRIMVDHIVRALGATNCILALPEGSGLPDGGGRLRIRASFAVASAVLDRFTSFAVDAPLAPAAAFRSGEPVWLETEEHFASFSANRWTAEQNGNRSGAGVPLVLGGESIGVIGLGYAEAHRFDDDERAFASALAAQGAQVLSRLQLRESERVSRLEAAEAERKLDFERARTERVLDEMAVAVTLVDTNGDVLLTNRAVRALWGVNDFPAERAERLRTFRGFTADGEEIAPDAWPFAITRDTRVPSQKELRILRPDGTEIWILMAASPVVKADGALEAIVTTALDISAIKSAQEETARARSAAEDANRAKDEFLAILGHELRNPLAPIATALHLMNERGSDQFAHERKVIERQVAHLGRLIDDLLDVSRIARGNIELLRRNVELAEVIERALELSRPLLQRNRNEIRVAVPEAGLMVDGDPTRLAQIFANLLTNASKYSSAGTPITLEARAEGGYVVTTVRDEGIGIPAELLPRVFDVFVQGPQSIDRARGGLGLGLAIVKNLAEMHGGDVSVASGGERQGSVLTVRLPLATGEVGRATPEPAAIPATARPLRILIVDDNVDAAELLSDVLAQMGHECTLAADGASGLTAAKSTRPHVVLLDLGLPMVDGFEVARELHAADLDPRPAIVALTGYGTAADRARTSAAGFAAHLVKPVDLQQLKRILSGVAAALRPRSAGRS